MAAEGLGLTDGNNVLIAEDVHAFPDQIEGLYTDEALWQLMSNQGRRYANERFGKDVASKQLLRFIRALIAPSAADGR